MLGWGGSGQATAPSAILSNIEGKSNYSSLTQSTVFYTHDYTQCPCLFKISISELFSFLTALRTTAAALYSCPAGQCVNTTQQCWE